MFFQIIFSPPLRLFVQRYMRNYIFHVVSSFTWHLRWKQMNKKPNRKNRTVYWRCTHANWIAITAFYFTRIDLQPALTAFHALFHFICCCSTTVYDNFSLLCMCALHNVRGTLYRFTREIKKNTKTFISMEIGCEIFFQTKIARKKPFQPVKRISRSAKVFFLLLLPIFAWNCECDAILHLMKIFWN